MNSSYCAGSDRSRPHWWCSAATFFAFAWTPSIVRAGSPGTRWIMKKQITVTPITTGIACSSRRRMYASRSSTVPPATSDAGYCDSQTSSMWKLPVG